MKELSINYNILFIVILIITIFYYLSYYQIISLLIIFIIYSYNDSIIENIQGIIQKPKNSSKGSDAKEEEVLVSIVIPEKVNKNITDLKDYRKYSRKNYDNALHTFNNLIKILEYNNTELSKGNITNPRLGNELNNSVTILNKCIVLFHNISYNLKPGLEDSFYKGVNNLYYNLYEIIYNQVNRYNRLFNENPNRYSSPIYLDSYKPYNISDLHTIY
ncbi:MAG: hypothetical protein CMG46_01920 [Candidatus Marinimicrobia bacterium]|nr:hypothetical protein [Candidatus Neomarinimicrobiota bacterium]|tara:strand:+ start:4282 stop:4932 length:651 start_codon:yes stop_codon:yes gene_type:complete